MTSSSQMIQHEHLNVSSAVGAADALALFLDVDSIVPLEIAQDFFLYDNNNSSNSSNSGNNHENIDLFADDDFFNQFTNDLFSEDQLLAVVDEHQNNSDLETTAIPRFDLDSILNSIGFATNDAPSMDLKRKYENDEDDDNYYDVTSPLSTISSSSFPCDDTESQAAMSTIQPKKRRTSLIDQLLNGDQTTRSSSSSSASSSSSSTNGGDNDIDMDLEDMESNKLFKKTLNKQAAIRYRQKKNKEKESLFQERDKCEQENRDLKKKIDDIQSEIGLVKNILVEMLLKKNIFSKIELANVATVSTAATAGVSSA